MRIVNKMLQENIYNVMKKRGEEQSSIKKIRNTARKYFPQRSEEHGVETPSCRENIKVSFVSNLLCVK